MYMHKNILLALRHVLDDYKEESYMDLCIN